MKKYDYTLSSEENFKRKQGYFYENSNTPSRIIDLNKLPFVGVVSNDLLSFKWDYITQGQAVQKIVKFEKAMVERKFQVLISSVLEKDYLGYLEQFLQLTDVDINNVKMGRLWYDNYYLEGYIFASTKKKKYLYTTKTMIELTIVSENGNWQSEESMTFYRNGEGTNNNQNQTTGYGFDYPYDYMYDYSAPFGSDTLLNESYLDTDFEITFHGPFENEGDGVYITIGGNDYRIMQSLDVDDYIKINSKTKTAVLYKHNGEQENVFAYRDKDWNLFEKIQRGGNLIIKPPNLLVDITLFHERSEPKYTEEVWT